MKEICGNCDWFNVKHGIQIKRGAPVNQANIDPIKTVEQSDTLEEGNGPLIFDKCKAVFMGPKGPQRYDFGTWSNSSCLAADDSGKPLFKAKSDR
jgi:hypothetical protein